MVLSDDPGASARIATFAASTERWLVAVRMVSEGVDIPRLAVGVYATSASTPLFFAQAIGRFVRARRPGETASVFLPSVPHLLGLASEMEAERDHVLGKPHREPTASTTSCSNGRRRRTSRGELDNGFETLAADAELDQVIFDGASFGTATPAGSEEEDYLGLPGLLDADQVRDLLRRRQEEQLDAARRRPVGTAPVPRPSTHGQLRELRKELNTLVSLAHHRTGSRTGGSTASCAGSAAGRRRGRDDRSARGQRIAAVRGLTA